MRYLLFLTTLIFCIFLAQTSANAHPADEIGIKVYDQKQTLEVSPNLSTLKIDLTFFAIDKAKLWSSINIDPDQELSEYEKAVWMKKGQEASWLLIDGKKYNFTATDLTIPGFDDFFSAKPVDISVTFTSNVRVLPGNNITYFYLGKDYKLETINFEVKGTGGLVSDSLRLASKDSYNFNIIEGELSEAQSLEINSSDRLNKFLDKYIKVESISPLLVISAILFSFLIGMLHALTPGHGKAILAGYLVGEKGTISHAIQLGLIITITHTSSVFLLGLGTLFLTQYIVPSVVVSILSLISGFLVTLFGLYLLIKRVKHLYAHTHTLPHSHQHSHKHSELELTWKNLLPLGISGGIVPCVDALAILIVAVSLGKIVFGLSLLLFFSLGLASALIIAGIFVVIAKQRAAKKMAALKKYDQYVSIISAVIVTILGILIIIGEKI